MSYANNIDQIIHSDIFNHYKIHSAKLKEFIRLLNKVEEDGEIIPFPDEFKNAVDINENIPANTNEIIENYFENEIIFNNEINFDQNSINIIHNNNILMAEVEEINKIISDTDMISDEIYEIINYKEDIEFLYEVIQTRYNR